MHDPRIGRFFAVDPLAPKYPHNSPYAFSENMVIHMVELEGLEAANPEIEYAKLPKLQKTSYNSYTGAMAGPIAVFGSNAFTSFYNGIAGTFNYAGDLGNPNDYWDLSYGGEKLRTDATAVYNGLNNYFTNTSWGQIGTDIVSAFSKVETWEDIAGSFLSLGGLTKINKLSGFTKFDLGLPSVSVGIRPSAMNSLSMGVNPMALKVGLKRSDDLVTVFHYTNKNGFNKISSNSTFNFKTSVPGKGHPNGVYLTNMSPEMLSKKPGGFKSYLGLTSQKSEYFFKFQVPKSSLKPLNVGRSHVMYSPSNLSIPRNNVLDFGKTSKLKF